MNTWHIHIEGRVQGVGFRPFVYNLAKSLDLFGWVNNTLDGVHIEFNATEKNANNFYNDLLEKAPELSIITRSSFFKSIHKKFDRFRIIHSAAIGKTNLLISPDFAICKDCSQELNHPEDRRNNYSFTTCTNCGPRYSITKKLPYDREQTTMGKFEMCLTCQKEFDNPEDRRYYSQTNSCPDCRIALTLFDQNKNRLKLSQNALIERVVSLWDTGKIVAIKGIGGYLLTCDAFNKNTVETLRDRKSRPSKPFAVMFPDLASINQIAQLNLPEKQMLISPASPIVLLRLKNNFVSNIKMESIAPELDQIGAMLPNTPLYQTLLQNFGRAIIATSGNSSNAPIIYEDEKALSELNRIADYILVNNRDIVVAQDDSVVKFSTGTNQKTVIRRSRGLAPSFENMDQEFPNKTILSTGADLKSTFSLLNHQHCYTSQYIGDLESYDSQKAYKKVLQHFLKLFDAKPEIILCDNHPNYFSKRLAERMAEELSVPIHQYQHHTAHFGAVLGENNLMDSTEKILGVIWDGTGFGDDGNIWGGEFFIYNNSEFKRKTHFDYFPFILGNKMSLEPRISALATCFQFEDANQFLKSKFSETEWKNYQKLLSKKPKIQSSSIGRVFDAVASLLNLIDRSTYEGEAAMLLENLATKYVDQNGFAINLSYLQTLERDQPVPLDQIMKGIFTDLQKGIKKSEIAAKFHFTLISIIKTIANQLTVKKIAFSGGVFQNSLLIDLIHYHLKNDFELYFHKELSPNDENISYGQLICYQIEQMKKARSVRKAILL